MIRSFGGFGRIPTVVKNLLIINLLFFVATFSLRNNNIVDLYDYLAFYFPGSESFKPFQFLTYMFMHADFSHIFFNMFAVWMFGRVLEEVWGPKRFLIFYLVTGIGAIAIQMVVTYIRIYQLELHLPPDIIEKAVTEGTDLLKTNQNWIGPLGKLNLLYNTPTVGASGAVFGILLAFGMLFPNTMLYVYFAIPIKAKYFVMIYGALEFFLGVANKSGDNVAHFAHLGGMVFGFFLILYWKKTTKNYY